MIEQNREEFFAQNQAKPCRHCLKRDKPGSGVGPLIGELLLQSYVAAEKERLLRLETCRPTPDPYGEILRQRNHEMYVRACWLMNVKPDASDIATDPTMLPTAA